MFILQCAKLKELITEVRDKLSKKDDIEPEEIRKSTTQLQQASLKLFEMAYKKVGKMISLLYEYYTQNDSLFILY